VLKCFGDLIGETIEAYMDDIVVKSKKANQLMADLEKTFMKLRRTASNSTPRNAFSGS
jgi:hypothetical protein